MAKKWVAHFLCCSHFGGSDPSVRPRAERKKRRRRNCRERVTFVREPNGEQSHATVACLTTVGSVDRRC